jgi:hypothetical protein
MNGGYGHVVTVLSDMLISNLWKACVFGYFQTTGSTADIGSGGYLVVRPPHNLI